MNFIAGYRGKRVGRHIDSLQSMDCFIIWVGVRLSRQLWLAYWGQHYSRVAVATADKAEDIVEEGTIDEETFDVEAVEEVGYGEIGSLDGSSSIQETKNSIGLVAVSRGSMS